MIFGWDDIADLALDLALVDLEFEKKGQNIYKKELKDFFANEHLKQNDMKLFSWKPDLINKLMIDTKSKEFLYSCIEGDWDNAVISNMLSFDLNKVNEKLESIFAEIVNSKIRWFKSKS